jgi:hypothetical protein
MSTQQAYEFAEIEYGTETFRVSERAKTSKQQRPTMGRRRGKTPQSFNGMHRRRRRKIMW